MATLIKTATASAAPFDAALWLSAFTAIGGGYALTPLPERKLWLFVNRCDADELTPIMAQIVGDKDRQQAIRDAIARQQNGEA